MQRTMNRHRGDCPPSDERDRRPMSSPSVPTPPRQDRGSGSSGDADPPRTRVAARAGPPVHPASGGRAAGRRRRRRTSRWRRAARCRSRAAAAVCHACPRLPVAGEGREHASWPVACQPRGSTSPLPVGLGDTQVHHHFLVDAGAGAEVDAQLRYAPRRVRSSTVVALAEHRAGIVERGPRARVRTPPRSVVDASIDRCISASVAVVSECARPRWLGRWSAAGSRRCPRRG